MFLKRFLNTIANTGVKNEYQAWEVHLTRKLNLSSLLGTFNVFTGLLIVLYIGYYDPVAECLVVLFLAPFIPFLNHKFDYIPALYLFTCIGCFLSFFLAVKMGIDSFSFLYYFPFILTVMQMGARKELYVHFLALVSFCFLNIVVLILSFHFEWYEVQLSEKLIPTMRYLSISFSFIVAIGFMFIVSKESIEQETQLKSALKQKDVLLAELFHRVKNNLSIVNSLLNLKKNAMSSPEAQQALEECRSLVFSMALVHTKIYNNNNIDKINFNDYLNDLVPELINSIGGVEKVDFVMNSTILKLNLSQAIPCGLIVNELVTNAFKHGQIPERKLKITINLREDSAHKVFMEVRDNGPGRLNMEKKNSSLGMELIHSLCEQLGGVFTFTNQDGLKFNLWFYHQTPEAATSIRFN